MWRNFIQLKTFALWAWKKEIRIINWWRLDAKSFEIKINNICKLFSSLSASPSSSVLTELTKLYSKTLRFDFYQPTIRKKLNTPLNMEKLAVKCAYAFWRCKTQAPKFLQHYIWRPHILPSFPTHIKLIDLIKGKIGILLW